MKWGIAVAVAFAAALALVLALSTSGVYAWFGSPMMTSGRAGGGGGPATASLSASPSSIASGASSTLTWGSTSAGSCISPGSLGNTAIPGFTGATSGSVSTGALSATTTYSVQCGTATAAAIVTVTTGGGLACVYGPNFTGTLPPPAARAGYSTCYENLDMSTAFGGNLANWLDCKMSGGAPLWFGTIGYYSRVTPTPCADYTIVSDTVNGVTQNVVDLAYTAADASGGYSSTWMWNCNFAQATGNLTTCPTMFPLGSYVEVEFKMIPGGSTNVFSAYTSLPACNGSNNPNGTNCSVYAEQMDYFGAAVQTAFAEFDFAEMDAVGGNVYTAGGSSFGAISNVYHSYSGMITTDGSGTATGTYQCSYLDQGAPSRCFKTQGINGSNPIPGSTMWSEFGMGASSGNTSCYGGCSTSVGGCGPCPSPSQTLHMRIAYIRAFTCPTYASGQCRNIPPITTP